MERQLYKRLLQAAWDCFSWTAATIFVLGARYDFTLSSILWSSVSAYLLVVCTLQVVIGILFMLYRGRYRKGSFDEITGLAVTVGIVGVAAAVYFLGADAVAAFPAKARFHQSSSAMSPTTTHRPPQKRSHHFRRW